MVVGKSRRFLFWVKCTEVPVACAQRDSGQATPDRSFCPIAEHLCRPEQRGAGDVSQRDLFTWLIELSNMGNCCVIQAGSEVGVQCLPKSDYYGNSNRGAKTGRVFELTRPRWRSLRLTPYRLKQRAAQVLRLIQTWSEKGVGGDYWGSRPRHFFVARPKLVSQLCCFYSGSLPLAHHGSPQT